MLSFFPPGVLDEILNLIESVSEDFPSYSHNRILTEDDNRSLFLIFKKKYKKCASKRITVNVLRIKQFALQLSMCPEDPDEMENNVEPEPTPFGAFEAV